MAIESFIETPRFPLLRGWLHDVDLDDNVDIVKRGRTREQRNVAAEYPLVRISVQIPRERAADIPYIYRFYRVMRGRATGFRVQDPSDYLSTDQGYSTYQEDPQPAFTDQPLVEVDGSSGTQFQLYKEYRIGDDFTTGLIELRIIRKPVAGTIKIGNHLGAEQAGGLWSLDTTTGILTVLPGFVGVPTTWGGEFDIACRFDSGLPRRVEDFRLDETSFVLKELPPT